MANKNFACGAHAIESLTGEAPRIERYPLAQKLGRAVYATAIYKGGIVQMDYNATVTGIYVIVGQATNAGAGNVLGCAAEYYKASDSTTNTIAVWTPDNVFAIQGNNTTTTTNANLYYQKNCNVTGQASGSTVTGLSSMQLKLSGVVTTTAMFRIIGQNHDVGESSTGAYSKFKCRFNFGFAYTDDVTAV